MEEGVPVVRDRWETTTTAKAAITSAMQRLDATSLSGPEPEQHCRAVLAELAETVAPIKQRWAEFAAAQLPESGDLHAALEALAKAEKVANGPVTPGSDDEPDTVAQVVDLISEAHAAVTNALRHIGRPAEAIDDDASSRRLGAELDEMLAERASGPSGPESPPWSLPRGVPPGPKIAEPPPMYDRPPGPGFDHPLAAPESRSAAPARSASLRHPVHRCCRSSRTRLRRRALRSARRTRRPRRSHPARSSTHLHRRTPTPRHPHPAPALARQAREPCPAQTPPPRRAHPTPHHHTRFLGRTRISACPGTDGFSAARRVIRGGSA